MSVDSKEPTDCSGQSSVLTKVEQWLVSGESGVSGPFSRLDLISMANGGKLSAESQLCCVRSESHSQWKALRDFTVLKQCQLLPRDWFTETELYYFCDAYGNEKGPVTFQELLLKECSGELHARSQTRAEDSRVWKWLVDLKSQVSDALNATHGKAQSRKREASQMRDSDLVESMLKEALGERHTDLVESMPKKKRRTKKTGANRSVYVSRLPLDCSEKELASVFSRCGVIEADIFNGGKPRVKLYVSEDGAFKGDALLTFAHVKSVQMAVDLLDSTALRTDSAATIRVQRAQFQGAKKSKPPKMDKRRIKVLSEMYSTKTKDSVPKLRFVVLENVFNGGVAIDSLHDAVVETMIAHRLKSVRKVECFGARGVVLVKFKEAVESAKCIRLMDATESFFQKGLTMKCYYWDGVSDYKS